jgi:predicted ribosomally synthesized peptide with nif11-like leader
MPDAREADFLNKVNQDPALKEKLRAAADADAVVSVATEAGFGDLAEAIRSEVARRQTVIDAKRKELSDKELEVFISRNLDCCTQTSIYSNVD